MYKEGEICGRSSNARLGKEGCGERVKGEGDEGEVMMGEEEGRRCMEKLYQPQTNFQTLSPLITDPFSHHPPHPPPSQTPFHPFIRPLPSSTSSPPSVSSLSHLSN